MRDFLGSLQQWADKKDVANVGAVLLNNQTDDFMCGTLGMKTEQWQVIQLLEVYPAVRHGRAIGVAASLNKVTWALFA